MIDSRLSRDCTDLFYARGAQVVLPMRVGGVYSQLDLSSLTPFSVASCDWLQLGVPHWATYCKWLIMDPTFCGCRFSTGRFLAIEDFFTLLEIWHLTKYVHSTNIYYSNMTFKHISATRNMTFYKISTQYKDMVLEIWHLINIRTLYNDILLEIYHFNKINDVT